MKLKKNKEVIKMGIFKKKQIAATVPAKAPEEDETVSEVNYVEQMSAPVRPVEQAVQPIETHKPVVQPIETHKAIQKMPEPRIIQVPVYLDQSGINELVIQNNQMLKELMAMATEED